MDCEVLEKYNKILPDSMKSLDADTSIICADKYLQHKYAVSLNELNGQRPNAYTLQA